MTGWSSRAGMSRWPVMTGQRYGPHPCSIAVGSDEAAIGLQLLVQLDGRHPDELRLMRTGFQHRHGSHHYCDDDS